MSIDPLEQRLAQLEVDAPDPEWVIARALAVRREPVRGRPFRIPAVALATVALAVAVLYFVPVAATALAGMPIGGDLLREAGLAGAAGRVTAVGAVADSSGVRLTLVGAYADSIRTVLLLHSSPAVTPGTQMDLSDQFGRSFATQSGYSDARTGDLILQFDPLGWPDSFIGARLTLKVSQVSPVFYEASTADWKTGNPVAGSWTLHASVAVEEAVTLATPTEGQLGDVRCTFEAVRSSAATIVIDVDLRGLTPEQVNARIPDGGKGAAVFGVALVDPNGQVTTESYSVSASADGTVVHLVSFRSGAGDYMLRITYQDSELDRTLRVP